MKELQNRCAQFLNSQSFDSLAIGVIDFSDKSYDSFQISPHGSETVYFDLASLTKPLTLGVCNLTRADLFDQSMILLLNHKAGLPTWGKLSRSDWREKILSYEIVESETAYSDFSALRLMLEIENKSGKPIKDLCQQFWNDELMFWKDLPLTSFSPITGIRNSKEIMGEVNDDNAYIIDSFCAHAGLFSTIDGLCKTMLNLDQNAGLLKTMNTLCKQCPHDQRFVAGWDRVLDHNVTLAGSLCGPETFGHLGFTGSSVWIDIGKKRGVVILTNATQKFWYDRSGLNEFRKEVANIVWSR